MTADMPPPPVPPDCDLRGLEWMPLYGGRLFQSDFDAHATDAEFRAATNLWWSAWNQVPAASLPDDDVALCRLAGLGRDLRAWKKVKDRAMHGFFKCSDGRFYHRAQAEFALDSWGRRLKDRERKARWREQRERKSGESDGDRTQTRTSPSPSQDASRGADRDVPGTADEMRHDETRQDETRRDSIGKGAASAGADTDRSLTDAIKTYWNEAAARVNAEVGRTEWATVQAMPDKRRRHLAARARECGGTDGIKIAIDKAAAVPWLRGETERRAGFENWRFNFDTLLQPGFFTKLMEGQFDVDLARQRQAGAGNGRDRAASRPFQPLRGNDAFYDELARWADHGGGSEEPDRG